ncbi:uncharacterized protein LOC120343937 [Styela clava]
MLRKKTCNSSLGTSDWSTYKENFCDLLERQHETPKRKRRFLRRKNVTLSSISQEIDSSSCSGDESCNVTNGDAFQPLSEDMFSSPVMHRMSPSNHIKSTPSGSPILLKSGQKTRTNSLIPLSPITPGLKWDKSLDRSVFSVHVQDSCHENFKTHEQTLLAMPLEFSDDDEINDEFTQAESTFVNSDIANNNEKLTQDDEIEIHEPDSQVMNFESPAKELDTTGSKWLKIIKEKIDEEWQQKTAKFVENSSFLNQNTSYFDSGKKGKFVKGGLAEQLTRVLKKENSQKSTFHQKIKAGKIVNQKSPSLLLKVISIQKEGILHIFECKEDASNETGTGYFTLILPDEFVSDLKINLGSNLKIFSPYYSVEVDKSLPIVILSAYCVVTEENFACLSTSSEKVSQNSQSQEISNKKNCESLLKCLEAQSSIEDGITIVTTILRIFRRNTNSPRRLSYLCSDAYGTFFVVDIGADFNDSEALELVENCEGQRVVFDNLMSSGRMTKSQFPALFSVVDSIWSCDGRGLVHVNSSQESGSTTQDSLHLLPPSYCYFLLAGKSSKLAMPRIDAERICENRMCQKYNIPSVKSQLNRPTNGIPAPHDVLYKHSKILSLAEIKLYSTERHARFSTIVKYIGIESNTCHSQDLYCNEHPNDVIMCVSESSGNSPPTNLNIVVKMPCYIPEKLNPGCDVIFKDLYFNDDVIIADSCSRIVVFNCNCDIHNVLCQDVPDSILSKICL